VFLYKPQAAYRIRWNMNTDTPWPLDEPRTPNPPEGAMIDYLLKSTAQGPVTIEILDAAGRQVRRYSSTDRAEPVTAATAAVPLYWYRPPQPLATTPGMHRFCWDLHYQPLPGGGGGRGGLPIAAVPYNTVVPPAAPWVAPGQYAVRLSVGGTTLTQPLTVRMDPRVRTPDQGLAQQYELSKALYDGALEAQAALQQLQELRGKVKESLARAGPGTAAQALTAFDARAAAVEGTPPSGGRGGFGGGFETNTLAAIGGSLTSLMSTLQGADATPTSQVVAAVGERREALADLLAKWNALRTTELAALNAQLRRAGLGEIK